MEVIIIYYSGFSRERRLACEKSRFSSLFTAGTFRADYLKIRCLV